MELVVGKPSRPLQNLKPQLCQSSRSQGDAKFVATAHMTRNVKEYAVCCAKYIRNATNPVITYSHPTPLVPNHIMRGSNIWHDTFSNQCTHSAATNAISANFPFELSTNPSVAAHGFIYCVGRAPFSQDVRMSIWRKGQRHFNRCHLESGASISWDRGGCHSRPPCMHTETTRPTQVQWVCVCEKLWAQHHGRAGTTLKGS